jgi:uncharacterized phage infection (PIP) family protein YhgE
MPQEPQGQAGQEPQSEGTEMGSAEAQVPQESQAVDYAALEEKISLLGDGYSLTNIADKVSDLRKGMNEAQRNLSETKKQYEGIDPLWKGMKEDPKLAQKLYDAAKNYYDGDSESGSYQPENREVVQSLNPLLQRITQLEVENAGNRIDREIERLRSDGMAINDDDYLKIMSMVQNAGDVSNIYAYAWRVCGPKMLQNASKQATESVKEGIKKNASSYIPTPSGQSSGGAPDISKMDKSQVDDMILGDLERMMNK